MAGSLDDQNVELITVGTEDSDVVLAIVVHDSGRVQFCGPGAGDREWVADILCQISNRIKADLS